MRTAAQQAAAAANFGVASARKRGSNSTYPYVPVIERREPTGVGEQIAGIDSTGPELRVRRW